jgi:hypothetical protein
MIELSELRELGFDQQFAQLASLGTNRVGVVLTNFDRDILYLCRSLHKGTNDRDGH